MSYHETYEFFAIHRHLTLAEVAALRRISTRATITPTRFFNYHDWGGLKADPRDLVRRYFDLLMHTGSVGDRYAMLRLPADALDRRVWRRYVTERRGTRSGGGSARLGIEGKFAILELYPADDAGLPKVDGLEPEDEVDEEDDWEDEDRDESRDDDHDRWFDPNDDGVVGDDEGSFAVPLALIRAELLAGGDRTLRVLYLLWLCSVQDEARLDRRVAAPGGAREVIGCARGPRGIRAAERRPPGGDDRRRRHRAGG